MLLSTLLKQSHKLFAVSLVAVLMLTLGCAQAQLSKQTTKIPSTIQNESISEGAETLAEDGKVKLKIGQLILEVDYANDPLERQLGLMYRKQICDDCGMLFKFDSVRTASIWMKNTYIPLDLAYIDTNGVIVDIQPLTPHDLQSKKSPKPVLYALEMNQGWFGKNNIRVGDKVELLP